MKKLIIRDIALFGLATTILVLPPLAGAGSLDSPAAPSGPGSAMFTTDDVYKRLESGAAGSKRGGAFSEAPTRPANGGRSLNDIMSIAPKGDNVTGASPSDVSLDKSYWSLRTDSTWGLQSGTRTPALVPRSGKTAKVGVAGEDGALRKGVVWPNPRFTDNSNGTVTDNLTGLVWLKDANCFAAKSWSAALDAANTLNSGECGLTDSSLAGDWRLPQIAELSSLVDYGQANPALPVNPALPAPGHPFLKLQAGLTDWYWSSTTMARDTTKAWCTIFGPGNINASGKTTTTHFVWPVRGGQ